MTNLYDYFSSVQYIYFKGYKVIQSHNENHITIITPGSLEANVPLGYAPSSPNIFQKCLLATP